MTVLHLYKIGKRLGGFDPPFPSRKSTDEHRIYRITFDSRTTIFTDYVQRRVLKGLVWNWHRYLLYGSSPFYFLSSPIGRIRYDWKSMELEVKFTKIKFTLRLSDPALVRLPSFGPILRCTVAYFFKKFFTLIVLETFFCTFIKFG